MASSFPLGQFEELLQDANGVALTGVSVEVRRQGASINGNQSGTSPLTVTVDDRGSIEAGDTVAIDAGSTTYNVDSRTATTVVLSGFAGTLVLTDDQRITPTNSLPSLFGDRAGNESLANPLTSGATGRAPAYLTGGLYDRKVSGGLVTTTLRIDANVVQPGHVIDVSQAPYYAKGDGTTNDTPAIQRAIDDIPSAGGTVFLPTGDYFLQTGLSTTKQGLVLLGAGGSGFGNIPDGASAFISNQAIVMLTLGDGITSYWNGLQIRNLSFRDSSGGGNAVLGGVNVKRMNHLHFDNVNFSNIKTGYAMQFDGTGDFVQYGVILNTRMDDCKFGVQCVGNVNALTFIGGEWDGGNIASGIGAKFVAGGDSCRLIGVAIQDFATCVQTNADHTIISCRFERLASTVVGVSITGGNWNVVEGSIFGACDPAISIAAAANYTRIGLNTYNSATDIITDAGATQTAIIEGQVSASNRRTQLNFDVTVSGILRANGGLVLASTLTATTGLIALGAPANLASATTVALPATGQFFLLTGTTTIDNFSGGVAGTVYTLIAGTGTVTIRDKSASSGNVILNGSSARTMTANTKEIHVMIFDGTEYIEVAHSTN